MRMMELLKGPIREPSIPPRSHRDGPPPSDAHPADSRQAAPYGVNDLHLCDAAVHKQFRPRDVAAVVGSEKNDGPGDLIGRAEPAERNAGENRLQTLSARS